MSINDDLTNAINAIDQAGRALNVARATLAQHLPAEGPDALLAQIGLLDARLTEILANDDSQETYRASTEIHGRLRRAKKDLDGLEARGTATADQISQTKAALRDLTDRLLREVFRIDGGDAGAAV